MIQGLVEGPFQFEDGTETPSLTGISSRKTLLGCVDGALVRFRWMTLEEPHDGPYQQFEIHARVRAQGMLRTLGDSIYEPFE